MQQAKCHRVSKDKVSQGPNHAQASVDYNPVDDRVATKWKSRPHCAQSCATGQEKTCWREVAWGGGLGAAAE